MSCITRLRDLVVPLILPGLFFASTGSMACGTADDNEFGRTAQLAITAQGIALPPEFELTVSRASEQMYEAWRSFLGSKAVHPVRVELLLLADLIAFEELKASLAPELPTVSGFYSIASNQAVVRYDARRMEETRRTAIHELSHLITTAQLGPAPVWLAEGIAEYYETMELTPSGPVVYPNDRHPRFLDSQTLLPLGEFLQLSATHWQGAGGLRNYAVSWSLVYFLMDSQSGRKVLKTVFSEMNANICHPVDVAPLLERAYEGGIAELEKDWLAWLKKGEIRPHPA